MEHICLQYRQELLGQVPARGVAIARPGVLIGGDEASERLVPSVMRSLLRGEAPRLLTAGAVRPWQHVLEACSGTLWLAAQLVRAPARTGPAYDFGLADPRRALPAGELARRLTAVWGGGVRPGPAVAAEIGYTQDCAAAADLGWTPVWTIDQAVERVVEWYRAPTDAAARRRVISTQVHDYVRDAVRSGIAWAAGRR
jgi:CDP-glucose 4,6-dehydratase